MGLRTSASGTTFSELVESLCLFLNCRSADKVYHVSIMPCFDKKLEASREQFYSDVFHTRDVDCVISTLEVEQMLLKDGVDLVCLPSADLDSMWGLTGAILVFHYFCHWNVLKVIFALCTSAYTRNFAADMVHRVLSCLTTKSRDPADIWSTLYVMRLGSFLRSSWMNSPLKR